MKSEFNFSVVRVYEESDFHYSFAGENQKNILVLFAKSDLETDVSYIEKIISTAKIELQKDCLYTPCDAQSDLLPPLALWVEKTNCAHIIIFGLSAEKFGCQFENYLNKCIAFADFKVVFCDSLARIKTASTDEKIALRDALRGLF